MKTAFPAALTRLACACLILTTCKDTSAPEEKQTPPPLAQVPARMQSASSTTLSGVVGTEVNERPSVFVSDAAGKAVAGVMVTFTAQGGNVNFARVTTDAQGIATVGAWILGQTAGTQWLTASIANLPNVTFSARAVAGPPSKLVKISGDNQVWMPGESVPAQLRAMVADVYGNGIVAQHVQFEVTEGGGQLTNALAETNQDGIAALGGWRLGAPGPQSVTVRSGNLPPETFKAVASQPVFLCGDEAPIEEHSPVTATLGSQCATSDGVRFQLLKVSIKDPGGYKFTVASTALDPRIELRTAKFDLVASNDNGSAGTTTSEVTALLPAGEYLLAVVSVRPGETGAYTASFDKAPTDITGCPEVFVTVGTETRQDLDATACGSPENPSDKYRIHLAAGESVTILVQDRSYLSPRVGLIDPDGSFVTSDVIENSYDHYIRYTPETSGYFTIVVSTDEIIDSYIFSIK